MHALALLALLAADPNTALSIEPDAPTPDDVALAARLQKSPAWTQLLESSPRISPDGTRAVYASNVDGTWALWEQKLDVGDAPRRVPKAVPRRFRRSVFSPDGKHLYFTADEQGDEAYAIFRLSLATGDVERVSDDEKLRRDGPFFTADGARMFFTARKMQETGSFLYAQEMKKNAKATRVFESTSMDAAAVSRASTRSSSRGTPSSSPTCAAAEASATTSSAPTTARASSTASATSAPWRAGSSCNPGPTRSASRSPAAARAATTRSSGSRTIPRSGPAAS
jgi:Tol biopolymer transport system component